MQTTTQEARALERKIAQCVAELKREYADLNSPSWEGVAAHNEKMMAHLFEMLSQRLLAVTSTPAPPFGESHMAVLIQGTQPDGVGMFHGDKLLGMVSVEEFDRIAGELAEIRR